jgi:hypothetical protein
MRILRNLLLAGAVGVTGLALTPATGHADPHWRGGGGWHHRHHHWRPSPRAYYAPPPVYYAPPPPVYYAPRPYYYAPPAYYAPPPRYYAPPSVSFGFTIP